MGVRFTLPEQQGPSAPKVWKIQHQRDGLLVSRLLREQESAGSTPATLTDTGTGLVVMDQRRSLRLVDSSQKTGPAHYEKSKR